MATDDGDALTMIFMMLCVWLALSACWTCCSSRLGAGARRGFFMGCCIVGIMLSLTGIGAFIGFPLIIFSCMCLGCSGDPQERRAGEWRGDRRAGLAIQGGLVQTIDRPWHFPPCGTSPSLWSMRTPWAEEGIVARNLLWCAPCTVVSTL